MHRPTQEDEYSRTDRPVPPKSQRIYQQIVLTTVFDPSFNIPERIILISSLWPAWKKQLNLCTNETTNSKPIELCGALLIWTTHPKSTCLESVFEKKVREYRPKSCAVVVSLWVSTQSDFQMSRTSSS